MEHYSIKLSTPSGEEVDLGTVVSTLQSQEENQQADYQPETHVETNHSGIYSDTGSNDSSDEPLGTSDNSIFEAGNAAATDLDEFFDRLSAAIVSAIGQIKVYVVESEITEAQKAVKAVVEQSRF